MAYDVERMRDDGFGHRWIGAQKLMVKLDSWLGAIHDAAGADAVITVSGVTGNLLIHRGVREAGRVVPGEVVAVFNLATERIEWGAPEDGSGA